MTLKLEVGKTYVDCHDRKVQIVHESQIPHRLTPFLGIVLLSTNEELAVYYGVTGNQGGHKSFDLVKEYVKPNYRWFNMYTCRVGNYFRSLGEALDGRSDVYELINTYRVDINTGDITKVEEGDDIVVIEDEEEAG